MGKTDYTNAFAMFAAVENKTAVIKALGGATITYRDLTMNEADAFSQRLIKSYGKDGGAPEIDYDEANKIKYEKVALILIEPKMSVDDLKKLSVHALEAINEISALVDPETKDETDKKGN